nr:protein DGCR6L isoform X9 [Pongo pygmaeus]
MCPPLPWLCRCSGCCLPRRTPGLQDRAALAGHGDAVADGHRSMKRTCLPREPRSWGSPGHIGNSQLRNHLKEPYTEPGLPGLAESQPQRDPPPGIRHCAQAGAAAEAPGSPAGLPAPQPACTSGGSAARTRELPSPPPTPSPAPWQAVEHRIHEEQRAMDRKIVLELDRKVADQQSTLEKAGVAGFYVTTNPQLPTGGSPC